MLEIIAVRQLPAFEDHWFFQVGSVQLDVPIAPSTGAFVIKVNEPLIGHGTLWIRECPADIEFGVPCAKILGTITFHSNGDFSYNGQLVPFYYTDF